MPRCPNCGRETLRTEDWACQWCGNPLLSDAFKKIDKTYRQLQEERASEGSSAFGEEPEPAAVTTVEVEPVPSPPQPEVEAAPEAPAPPEPISEVETEAKAEDEIEPSEPEVKPPAEEEPVAEAEPTDVAEIESEAEPEPEVKPPAVEEPVAEAEPAAVAEAESEAEPEPEPAAETEPETEVVPPAAPAVAVALEPDVTTGAIRTTVDELNTSFNSDKAGTNNKLLNKLLQVTGTVEKVFARDNLDIYYIILAGGGGPSTWSVRCSFSREHNAYLSRLTEGDTATVQGTYVGYERNIILKECSLI
jgi:hypothetical protein